MPMLGGTSSQSGVGPGQQPGIAGRPKAYGKFALRPISGKNGWAISNTDPEAIMKVQEQYLSAFALPPGLAPTRSRTLQNLTNRNISRGFMKPKDGRT